MSELLKLAERCEAAIGPDRELDAAIAIANGSKAVVSYGHPALGNFYRAPAFFKHYTASLDAAMMLVPEGIEGLPLSYKVERFYLGNGILQSRSSVFDGLGVVSSLDTVSNAATAALALCAAALRARDALNNSDGGGE